MNNKGFISISVVYSFFIVFLLLLLFIVDNLVNNRLLLNNIKDNIKNEVKIDNRDRLEKYIIDNYYQDDGKNGLYLHDGKGLYGSLEAKDNSYRYSGGDYNLTEKAIDLGYRYIISTKELIDNNLIDIYCDAVNCLFSDQYTTERYYTLSYDESKIKYETLQQAREKAVVDGYLTSDNIKNFVCFATDEEICPLDNLYRIIGIFNENVKIIKYNYSSSNLLGEDGDYSLTGTKDPRMSYIGDNSSISSYYFNYNKDHFMYGSNEWENGYLNKINLNTNYINSIGKEWSDTILSINWNVGKVSSINALDFYNAEITAKTKNKYKIGLIYLSEYGFAASPNHWQKFSGFYGDADVVADNWLYMGYAEWALNPSLNSDNIINHISSNGEYNGGSGGSSGYIYVRPVMYLKNSVKYVSGEGTIDSPFRISM